MTNKETPKLVALDDIVTGKIYWSHIDGVPEESLGNWDEYYVQAFCEGQVCTEEEWEYDDGIRLLYDKGFVVCWRKNQPMPTELPKPARVYDPEVEWVPSGSDQQPVAGRRVAYIHSDGVRGWAMWADGGSTVGIEWWRYDFGPPQGDED